MRSKPLRSARVHIGGTGRLGCAAAESLEGAGVGALSGNDPQHVEPENLNGAIFTSGDIGRKKVDVLQSWFETRGRCRFEAVPLPVEAAEVDAYIEAADLVISCANSVRARIVTGEKAIRYGKPMVQVAAFDPEDCWGGLISIWIPEHTFACPACFLDPERNWSSAGRLLATVTATLGAMAANMAVAIMTGVRAELFRERNLFYVDIQTYAIEALAVEKRSGCSVCGKGDAH